MVSEQPEQPKSKPAGPPEPDVHRAARTGNISELERLVENGVDIDHKADFAFDHGPYLRQLTPLMIAAASTEGATVETIRWLVRSGADVRLRSEGGCTAAWYAAGGMQGFFSQSTGEPSDHHERLQFLLDAGLSARERSANSRSLLSEACRTGDARRVRILLERGAKADVTARGEDDEVYSFEIPIFCAAESGSAECVELILAARADSNCRDNMHRTPLMAVRSRAAAQALIAAGADINAKDEFGSDVLQVLLQDSSEVEDGGQLLDVAQMLIASGVDIEWRDEYGHTRLYSIAFTRASNAVEFLLQLGADPHAKQSEEGTPLHAICWQGHSHDDETEKATVRIIKTLIGAGILVDTVDSNGNTPLIEAVSGDWGSPTAVRTLIDLGADPNRSNHHGATALMIAASMGERDCIRELIRVGADPILTDNDGRSPLDYAREHLDVWKQINAEPPNIDFGLDEDPDEMNARHQDAYETARQCVEIIENAMKK